ncbi:hypothetical protein SAMN05192573_103306 [Mucilaginibacter gossypii]|uniref:Uncharacterized protein n=1 Tax=Mucilaginibacter gossypii TaxID=551996 RepID=A0A1G7TYS9_9SPHI|nr:hypothetical protein SAMN05192573_103306 [Mucilaginibacter gossypii]
MTLIIKLTNTVNLQHQAPINSIVAFKTRILHSTTDHITTVDLK